MMTPEDIEQVRQMAVERSDKRQEGLYPDGKYYVFRRDEQDLSPGDKHFGCQYFVLDVTHDPYAAPALRAYAEACRREYPKLADDLERCVDDSRDKERMP